LQFATPDWLESQQVHENNNWGKLPAKSGNIYGKTGKPRKQEPNNLLINNTHL